MTDLSAAEITHLAGLARIRLSDEEVTNFSQELPKIVGFVEELQKMKLSTTVTEKPTVELADLRSDEVSSERLSPEIIKKLAPNFSDDDQVVVPAVFGEPTDD